VQFGVFSPILRTHTTKNPEAERRIWAYPEPYSAVLRSAFQLRYALQPYLYTEARRTYDTGVAFLHPLYYDWPEEENAYSRKGEYVFGAQMIAAPITAAADKTSGLASEQVWLPSGGWIEWPTGKHISGPATVERSFSIDQIPVYLREGAIVPMQPQMLYTGQKPIDPLIINVWPLPSGASSDYSLYEDSGRWVEYQWGVFARTPIHATQTGDTLRVEIGPVQGGFPGMLKTRSYELRLPADWPPMTVSVNGKTVPRSKAAAHDGWSFEGDTLTTVIPALRNSTAARVAIIVRRARNLVARRGELDGFAGVMNRLRGSYDALQQTYPLSTPPDLLIEAMQTGDRIGYHPERAGEEIARMRELLPKVQATIASLSATFMQRLNDPSIQIGGASYVSGDLQAEKQRRLNSFQRAQLLISGADQ
jgi:alpha-glucosidase